MNNGQNEDQMKEERKIPLPLRWEDIVSNQDYLEGFEAAYAEIYTVIGSDDHPGECEGWCRPCQVIRAVTEDLLLRLGRVMTDDEFEAMAEIIAKMSLRMKGE